MRWRCNITMNQIMHWTLIMTSDMVSGKCWGQLQGEFLSTTKGMDRDIDLTEKLIYELLRD